MSETYATEFKFSVPVGNLVFLRNTDKKEFQYDPKEDITPHECAMFLQLICYATTAKMALEWENFVSKHNLWKHLKEVPNV